MRIGIISTVRQARKKKGSLGCSTLMSPTGTLLTLGGSYQRDDAVPFSGGLPFYADGSDSHLPRSTSLAFSWSRYRTRSSEFYAQVQQKFSGDWKLKLNATSFEPIGQLRLWAIPVCDRSRHEGTAGSTVGAADRAPQYPGSIRGRRDAHRRIQLVRKGASTLPSAAITHITKAAWGLDYLVSFGTPVANVFDYDPAAHPEPAVPSPTVPPSQSVAVLNQSGGIRDIQGLSQ